MRYNKRFKGGFKMQNYIKESNDVLQIAEVDVLVCGAGPAGIGAAIMASRLGASVMVVEAQGCLGGIATAGMMSHWGGRRSHHHAYDELA